MLGHYGALRASGIFGGMEHDRELREALPHDPEVAAESHRELASLARVILGDEHLADDVVQDAWLVALQRGRERLADPRAWLRAVVLNRARHESRARGRRANLAHGYAAETALQAGSEGEDDDPARAHQVLRESAAQLTAPHREVIELRFFEGRSIAEIAAQLGRRASTVRSQLSRAVKEMRDVLERRFGDRAQWSALILPLARRGGRLGAHSTTSLGGLALVLLATMAATVLAWLAWSPSRDGSERLGQREGVALVEPMGEPSEVAPASLAPSSLAHGAETGRVASVEAEVSAEATTEAAATGSSAAEPPARRIVVALERADGGSVEDIEVIVGRTVGAQRTVRADRSPVTIELAPSDIERAGDTEVVHMYARARGQAESLAAMVTLDEPERRVTLTTRGAGQRLAFHVVDESGAAVPAARLQVSPPGRVGRTESEPGVVATDRIAAFVTDGDGRCVHAHAPRVRRTVRVMHDGYADVVQDVEIGDVPLDVVVKLRRGVEVHGRVTLPNGAPAVGVVARVVDLGRELRSGLVRSAKTDDEGRFALRGLTPMEPVHIFVEDPSDDTVFATAIATPAPFGASTLTPALELVLAPRDGLELRLVDPRGAPLAACFLALSTPTGSAPMTVFGTTDAEGRARFAPVPDTPLEVLAQRSFGDSIIVGRDLRAGPDVHELVCPDAPGERGGVFGAIVAASGAPLAGAQVLGYRDGEFFRVDVAAEDGRFRASGLLPGEFDLHATTQTMGSYHLGKHAVAGAGSTDLGIVSLPAPTVVKLDWGTEAPTPRTPWRVFYIPADRDQGAIEARLLAEPTPTLELLPGRYRFEPQDPTGATVGGVELEVSAGVERTQVTMTLR
jgi:RNA polymerase sigma-70 factor (ECF subfamily)